MPISIIRRRRWETSLVQGGHESELLQACYTRHIQPATRPSLEVVSVVLNGAETCAAQPCQLYDYGLAVVNTLPIFINGVATLADVDI